MADTDKKSLSRQIETTIEGFFRFLVAYLRTSAAIGFQWRRGLEKVICESERGSKDVVYPFTYLVIGGFLFSLVVAVYPDGFMAIFDLIWFDKEIVANFVKKFDQAFSLTTLLIGGFPTFLSVVALSRLSATLDEPQGERREKLTTAYRYVFGYQAAALFAWFAVFLLPPVAGAEPCSLVPSFCGDGIVADAAGWAGLLSFPFFFLIVPLVTLAIWRWKSLSDRPRLVRCWGIVKSAATFAIIMWAYSSVAGLPARISGAVAPPPAPSLAIERASLAFEKDGTTQAAIVASVKNPTDEFAVVHASDFSGTLLVEKNDSAKWSLDDFQMSSAGQTDPSLVLLAPHSGTVVKLRATVTLANANVQDYLRKLIDANASTVTVQIEANDPKLSSTGYVRSYAAQ